MPKKSYPLHHPHWNIILITKKQKNEGIWTYSSLNSKNILEIKLQFDSSVSIYYCTYTVTP